MTKKGNVKGGIGAQKLSIQNICSMEQRGLNLYPSISQ